MVHPPPLRVIHLISRKTDKPILQMTHLITLMLLLGFTAPVSAQSQDINCDVDDQQRRNRYSLYFEHFRAGNFEAARPDLEWILVCAPTIGGTVPDDRNFLRAVQLYENLAQEAAPEEQATLLGLALEAIDAVAPTLDAEGVAYDRHYWLIRQGRFLQTHATLFPERQGEVCGIYEEAFEINPEETGDYYLQIIALCVTEAAIADDTPEVKRETRTFIEEQLLIHVDSQQSRDYIQAQAERLITTPREMFAYLYERYQAVGLDGMNDDEIEQLFNLNQQAGSQFFEDMDESRELRRVLLAYLSVADPTYSRLVSMSLVLIEEEDHQQAIVFLERALDLAETPEQTRDLHYNIARARSELGQFAPAANHLRETLSIDPNHGPSLFLMGSMIQRSIPSSSDIRVRAAWWCAADYYSRASSAGVNGAGAAAAGALRAAPSPEDYFFVEGWEPGVTISASYGWGSCQTRIR